MRDARHKDRSLHESQFHDLLNSKIKKTQEMVNKCDAHTSMCSKTEAKYKSLVKVKFCRHQSKTHAHEREENDCRNAVSYGIGICSGTADLNDEDCFSFDASSFETHRNGSLNEQLVAVVCDDEEKNNDSPISSNTPSDLCYSIKGQFASSRGGNVAPVVVIIADVSLEKGIFKVHEVPGLCVTGSANDVGYIVFSPTRAGSVSLWKWWIRDVFVPFILQCRRLQKFRKDQSSFFTADGEDFMLEALTSHDILELFKSHNIGGGKIPASYSPIAAAWDKSKALFQGSKKAIKHLTPLDVINTGLSELLVGVMKSSGLTLSQQKNAIEGVVKLKAACVEKMNPTHVRHSYEHVGQRALLNNHTVGPDFETILTLCIKKNTLTAEQKQTIISQYEPLKAFHDEHGMITDEFMSSLGITDFTSLVPYNRDHRSMGRSRFVLFTAEAAKERFHLGEEQKKLMAEHVLFSSEDKISHSRRVDERKLAVLEKKLSRIQKAEDKRIRKILSVHFAVLKGNWKAAKKEEMTREMLDKRAAKAAPKTTAERKRKSREQTWNCLNPLCMIKWEEDHMNAQDWLVCDFCENMFCPKLSCLSMMDAHEIACKSSKCNETSKKKLKR